MLFPIRHENMSARRWPVVTIGLITINTVIFLFTHYGVEDQSAKLKRISVQTVVLAAAHPELQVSPEVRQMVSYIQERAPKAWATMMRLGQTARDFDARRGMDGEALQQQMDSLCKQITDLRASLPTVKYGFIPAEERPVTYITANFLHLSWLHLIGNMWFLWLAGFVLEDHWGRIVYIVFYLLAGAAAQQLYGWMSPGSITPAVGASGAVAGLMGAFLVRFPKMKIEMMWLWIYRFKARAYWLLTVWLLIEIVYGTVFGASTGIAHWAHVGGFVFGAIAAYGLSLTRVEQGVNQSLDEKAEWQCDPALAQATKLIEQNQPDQALVVLNSFMASHPDSLDAAHLLQQIYWRKANMPGFREASLKLCALQLKARDWESAWRSYQELRNLSDTNEEKLPASLWFDLCRAAENLKNLDVAFQEYQELASAYPADRHGLMAQIAAGRICLSHLQRPREALNIFQDAAASPVPHLDWEQTIAAGIRSAQAAISGSQSPASAALANR